MISNITSNILFGKRYERMEDEGLLTIINSLHYFEEGLYQADPVSVFPWLRFLPIQSFNHLKKFKSLTEGCITNHYNEHVENLNADNLTSVLGYMINASRSNEMLKQYGLNELSRETIKVLMSDLIVASIDTTVTDLTWLVLRLLHYPAYIEEAFHEIRDVTGTNKKYPELKDRSSLPVVQAIIQESLRMTSGVFSIQHKATRDSSIGGYPIKCGTQVLFDLWSLHRDQRYWDDPYQFNPHRWLDGDGKFNPYKHKSYLPFFLGKRACIGEQIARAEIFLIVTRLIVDFKIEKDPSCELPKLTEGKTNIGFSALPYKVVLNKRQ